MSHNDHKNHDPNHHHNANNDDDEYDAPPLSKTIERHEQQQALIPEAVPSMQHPYFGMLGGGHAGHGGHGHGDFGSSPAAEGTLATAGEPLPPHSAIASLDAVIDALRTVYDPEIPVNIYDLGLIYQQDILENGDCQIVMTLTAPACPVAGEMPTQVANAVAKIEGIGLVHVTLTWSPPWDQSMMSEDAKLALDIW